MKELNNRSSLIEQARDIRKKVTREKFSGYPRLVPFESPEEIERYLSQEEIDCLICGRRLRALSAHLARIHRVSTDDYKLRFGLPYTRGLTCAETSEKLTRHGESLYIGTSGPARRERIRTLGSSRKGKPTPERTSALKRATALNNIKGQSKPPIKAETVEKVVAAVESGLTLRAAITELSVMAETAFRDAIARYPDLRLRYDAAKGKAKSEALKKNNPLDGKRVRGSDAPKSKLDEREVRSIRLRIASGERLNSIARDFCVSWSSIDAIKRGSSWGWLK